MGLRWERVKEGGGGVVEIEMDGRGGRREGLRVSCVVALGGIPIDGCMDPSEKGIEVRSKGFDTG